MVTFDDVARIATGLPEVTEHFDYGKRVWKARGVEFLWEFELYAIDYESLEMDLEPPPLGPLLCVCAESLDRKAAVIDSNPEVFSSIPKFNYEREFLVRLDAVDDALLTRTVKEAWLTCAPARLTDENPSPDIKAED